MLAAGTILSAMAPIFRLLLAGRALAGLGGAVVFAGCLAAAGDLFPDAARRNRAIGLIWSAITLASFLGVPLLALLVPVAVGTVGTFWLPVQTPERARPRQRVAVVVVVHLAWGGSFVFFGAYAATRFAADATALSLLFLVGGAEIVTTLAIPAGLRRIPARHLYLGLTLIGVAAVLGVEFGNRWVGAWSRSSSP